MVVWKLVFCLPQINYCCSVPNGSPKRTLFNRFWVSIKIVFTKQYVVNFSVVAMTYCFMP